MLASTIDEDEGSCFNYILELYLNPLHEVAINEERINHSLGGEQPARAMTRRVQCCGNLVQTQITFE